MSHVYVDVWVNMVIFICDWMFAFTHIYTCSHRLHFKEGIAVRKTKSTTLLHYYFTFCQESS